MKYENDPCRIWATFSEQYSLKFLKVQFHWYFFKWTQCNTADDNHDDGVNIAWDMEQDVIWWLFIIPALPPTGLIKLFCAHILYTIYIKHGEIDDKQDLTNALQY